MDFEGAAQRLARDQQKIRVRKPDVVSEQAKKQAEFQRIQRAKLQEERERKRRLQEYQTQKLRSWERSLRLKNLGPGTSSLLLQPTSIHGTGDKISLPSSVLEILTTKLQVEGDSMTLGNPWTFRIGIPFPDYQFPSSPLLKSLNPPSTYPDDQDDDLDCDDHEDDTQLAYLEELAHKYIAYTHCSVVEFTQDEGHVGIPQHIASALLNPKNRLVNYVDQAIPTTRTVDPAKSTLDMTNDGDVAMEEDTSTATPGHVAYGAFDVPSVPLEISLVTLPKGTACTLVPTEDAVRRGFYLLKDVKFVLEQSLIRTRATLSNGDKVSTWHRGVQYDLHVTKVVPSAFGAVTCINTDIEVDIGETTLQDNKEQTVSKGTKLGTGSVLGSTLSSTGGSSAASGSLTKAPDIMRSTSSFDLRPEPPVDQTENIYAVQIRSSGANGKRRFDVSIATVRDLFDFAQSLLLVGGSSSSLNDTTADVSGFRLVTRFPRKVYSMEDLHPTTQTLAQAGIQAGQEVFMVEMI